MKRRIALFGMMLSLAAVTVPSSVAHAQAAGPAKIAVVNLREVYQKLAETGDLQKKLQGMNEDLSRMQTSHKAQIDDFQHQITQVKVESSQHDEMMAKLDDMQLDFKRLETLQQVKMVREQNHQIIHAFNAIQATVADMAKREGYDLVLVNNDTDVPANAGDIANQETVANLVFNRNVLFAGDKANITAKVIASVDAGHAAAPAPAPAK